MTGELPLQLAAVHYERGFAINLLMHEVVAEVKRLGYDVGGVLQKAESPADWARLLVVDVRSDEQAVITQNQGKDSAGCKLDPRGLAEIAHCIDDAVAAGIDLIVISKFGRAEAEGSGLLASFAAAALAEVPLLTAVREPYLEAWQSFHGGYATALPTDLQAILFWNTHCQRNRPMPIARAGTAGLTFVK